MKAETNKISSAETSWSIRPPFARFAAIALALASAANAAEPAAGVKQPDAGRGLWFWSKPASPSGAVRIVGTPAAEQEALATFARWRVRRLYGSYAAVPAERPDAMARWNRQLHDAGVRSESLFSDNGALAPAGRAGLLRLVDERVLEFNRRRSDPRERFVGIALDIEPHATPRWKTAGAEQRRAMLEDFLTTCVELRQHLDAHGGQSLPISAALAYWLDRVSTEKPGWKSAADRDDWFARLARCVPSISLMAYERAAPAAILEATEWERGHFAGTARTALRARLGVEWKSLGDLVAVLPAVETVGGGVDIENYELLRAAERAAAAPAP